MARLRAGSVTRDSDAVYAPESPARRGGGGYRASVYRAARAAVARVVLDVRAGRDVAWRDYASVGVRVLWLPLCVFVVGVVRAAITGALAALLVCVVFAQAVPRPLPAPAGMRDHVVTLRE